MDTVALESEPTEKARILAALEELEETRGRIGAARVLVATVAENAPLFTPNLAERALVYSLAGLARDYFALFQNCMDEGIVREAHKLTVKIDEMTDTSDLDPVDRELDIRNRGLVLAIYIAACEDDWPEVVDAICDYPVRGGDRASVLDTFADGLEVELPGGES